MNDAEKALRERIWKLRIRVVWLVAWLAHTYLGWLAWPLWFRYTDIFVVDGVRLPFWRCATAGICVWIMITVVSALVIGGGRD